MRKEKSMLQGPTPPSLEGCPKGGAVVQSFKAQTGLTDETFPGQ